MPASTAERVATLEALVANLSHALAELEKRVAANGPALSGGPGTPRGEAAGVWLTPDEENWWQRAAMEQAELPIDEERIAAHRRQGGSRRAR